MPGADGGAHHEVLVVGGGNAGCSAAARLLRDGVRDVAVVEPQRVHRYRPLLNYVGAGEAAMADLERPAAEVLPRGGTWLQDRVVSVDPAARRVRLAGGEATYDHLVVCPGLEEDWDATPGLRAAYDAGWAGSTFVVDTAAAVWPALSGLTRGRVLFDVPPEPAPCGPTALKPLLMACDHWRRRGLLGGATGLDVHLALPGREVVGLPGADERLDARLAAYGVTVHRGTRVASVSDRSATLVGPAGEHVLEGLEQAHLVPRYRAPAWVAASGLAGRSPAGLVDVDHATLRHRRHPEVWSLGDVADLGTRPSGGALRKQVDVLARNLGAVREGRPPEAAYDGYTVVPVTTDRRRLVLVEVDRDGRPAPTVPFPDLARPRRTTWLVDRYLLPQTYWRRILRGKV